MDNKRYRDVNDEPVSPSGKRARLDQASDLVTNVMQAVAHEALAMTNGSGFLPINRPAPASPPSPQGPRNTAGSNAGDNSPKAVKDQANGDSNFNNTFSYVYGNTYNIVNNIPDPTAKQNGVQPPLETMSDITRCFKSAVVSGWERRWPTYAHVGVLMLYWDDDDDMVKEITLRLDGVFRTKYHFTTEVYAIQPIASASDLVYAKVDSFFTRNNSPENLAILHYAGKSVPNEAGGHPPIWASRHNYPKTTINSGPIQAAYESACCDVLLLLDHCHVYHAPLAKQDPGSPRRNVIEVIGAPASEPSLGHINFTRVLASELAASSRSGPLHVEALHTQASNRMTVVKPRGRGRPPKEPPAQPEQLHLPKHYWLLNQRSIVLAPQPSGPQVVICIRVLNGSDVITKWATWIFNANPDTRNTVQIEGLYLGFSTMIVLRVPATKWDAFPECPGGSIVGYTTIGTIAPDLLDRIDQNLSTRLWDEGPSPLPIYPTTPRAPLATFTTSADALPAPVPAPTPTASVEEPRTATDTTQEFAAPAPGSEGDANNAPPSQKKPRKALPTERKLLPSGAPSAEPRRNGHSHQQSPQTLPYGSLDGEFPDKSALLATTPVRPLKISIKQAGQTYQCKECTAGFKDIDALQNHVRKQHTRPFHCVFKWAGCESTFASKNEWKRHVMSQHILLYYWACQVETCSNIVNKAPGAAHRGFSLPNGAIFNRKDLYTQHLRRMHTPPHVKKLLKQAKVTSKIPSHQSITEWENRLRDLQQDGMRPRCRLPDYMICPAPNCGAEFRGGNAWDERMEHVARHLEAASAGREPPVVFGGKSDPTLTGWATRPEVGIAKRIGPNTWHLDNPLRPEIMEWIGREEEEEEEEEGGERRM